MENQLDQFEGTDNYKAVIFSQLNRIGEQIPSVIASNDTGEIMALRGSVEFLNVLIWPRADKEYKEKVEGIVKNGMAFRSGTRRDLDSYSLPTDRQERFKYVMKLIAWIELMSTQFQKIGLLERGKNDVYSEFTPNI